MNRNVIDFLQQVDEERFEDDPREFIVTEVEGSDSESRRRCSEDLLRAMCRQFEAETTAICYEHVGSMLREYATDQTNKWVAKDAAVSTSISISRRLARNLTIVCSCANKFAIRIAIYSDSSYVRNLYSS